MIIEFPWKRPSNSKYSHYETDGPEETVEFIAAGARFRVAPAKIDAIHTARGRFRVECLSCDTLIHRATTGPATRVTYHVEDFHKEKTEP